MGRIREEYVGGRTARDVIDHGIAAIGGVVLQCGYGCPELMQRAR